MGSNIEDEVITLNAIFRQLREDAVSIAKDLLEAIKYWEKFCDIVMLYGIILTLVGIYYSFAATTVTAVVTAVIGVGSIFYAVLIRRDYTRIRNKYAKLIEMYEEIKKEIPEGS